MGKRFKWFTAFTMLLICLLMTTMSASAADGIVLSADAERVERGGEVLVSLDLGEDAALHAYAAKLSYDQNVFEPIEKNSFQAQESWSDIVYNSENNKFGLINKSGESGSKVLEIKFKVKDDAKAGATKIVVDNVSVSDGGAATDLAGSSVDIYIKENALDDTEATAAAVEITDEGLSVSSGSGNTWLGILLAALAALVVAFAVVFFIKVKNTKKRVIATSICAVATAGLIFGSVWIFASKQPDVNADGKVDYDDAKDVLEYLLEIDNEDDEQSTDAPNGDAQGTGSNDSSGSSSSGASSGSSSSNSSGGSSNAGSSASSGSNVSSGNSGSNNTGSGNAGSGSSGSNNAGSGNTGSGNSKPDVNDDGKVDIGDVGEIVDDAKDTEYKAELGECELSAKGGQNIELVDGVYYVPKGEKEITVGFEATVNPHTLIKEAVINGKSYSVSATKISGTKYYYMADVPAPEAAGKKTDVTITQITLDNGKKLDVNGKLSVEMLKDKLTLSNYTFSENKNEYNISFDIDDPDGSLVNGNIMVKGENGEAVEITPNDIKAGSNIYTLKGLKAGVKYTAVVTAKYDLDSERDNGAHDGLEILLTKEIEAVNYALEMKNAAVSVDRDNGKVVIEFESTVAVDGRYIEKAIINGKAYAAKRVGSTDRYRVEIPYEDESAAVYKITGVILDNETQLEMDKTVELETFKTAPTASELKLTRNENDGVLEFSWSLNDEDDTVSAVYAILKRNGSVVETKKLSKNEMSAAFELEKEKYAGAYTAEIAADFELFDGKQHQKETLGSKELEIAVEAQVSGLKPAKQYPAKGETVKFSLDISSNTADDATAAVVNGSEYRLSRSGDGKYSFEYKVQDKAGFETVKLEKILFSDISVNASASASVDVLKDKPAIKDFVFDDSEDKHILSFTLEDKDDAFVKGEVTVTNEKGEKVETIEIDGKREDYKFELNLTENGIYHLSASVSYDLDSNKQNSDNSATAVMAERDIEVLVDYKFTFSDAKIKSIDNENKSVTISFVSTNASKYYGISKVVINGKDYEVKRNGDNYTVTVELDSAARTELTLTKAVLEDMRSFDVDPSETGFVVFKSNPAAQLELNAGRTSIDLDWTILDYDKTLKTFGVRLKDSDGKTVAEKSGAELGAESSGKTSFTGLKAGVYTAEMLADFDPADGLEHKNEVIGTRTIAIETVAEITKCDFDRKYIGKNEEISISYTIDKNTDEQPTALTVNGKDCPITKIDGDNCTISYTAGNKAGVEDIVVTEIKFADAAVPAEHKDSVEVLKTAPSVSELDYNGADKPSISFTLTDDDDALISGSIVVTGGDGYKNEIPLDKNKSAYDLGLEENGVYNVSVMLTYDLDSDKRDNINRETKELASKEIEVLVKYNFTFTDAKIKSVDYDSQTVTLGFNSTNASIYKVAKVTINGTEYDAKADGDSYTVEIKLDSRDRTELKITGAELEDHKSFDVNESFVVFKKAPIATLNAVTGEDKIDVSYIIVDQENIAKDIKLVIKTADEAYSGTRDIKDNEGTITFPAKAGAYSIEITASYDAVDGKTHKDETLVSDDVIMAIDVDGVAGKISKTYAEKGESVDVVYTVDDNTYEEIKSFTVNGSDYPAEKQSDDTYKISYKTGKSAGAEAIELTAVNYATETVAAACSNTVEVLKDEPSITGFDYNGSEKAIVSFTLNDPDNAFVSGTITATDAQGDKTEVAVEKGRDSYDLGLKENGKYSVSVNITYDRDSERDNGKNQKTEELYSGEIQVIVDYKFKLESAAVKSVDYDSKTVELTFNSTNASVYPVTKVTINGSEYDAVRSGDNYTVKLTLENRDKTELNITAAELEDHNKFSVSGVSVVVFKTAPSASLNLVPGEDKIDISYVVMDSEGIAHDLKLVLCDVYGETIETKEIKARASYEGTAEFAIEKAGAYTVKLLASFDAVDGRQHADEELVSDDIDFAIDIDNITGTASKSFADKGESIGVTYKIEDNTYEDVVSFTIGGSDYAAEKVGDNEYKISYKVSDAAGTENIDVTAVNYEKESVSVSCRTSIEVLKDAPTIDGFTYDGSEEPKISFKLNDDDDTFVSGVITVTGSGGFKKDIPVIRLVEDYNLGIDKNGVYNVSINITYDRDSDKEDKGYQTTSELAGGEIQVLVDYEFKLTNAKIKSIDNDKKTVVITFDSTNASMYKIAKVTVNDKEYQPEVKDNTYTVEVTLDSRDKTELKLTRAELEDKMTFDLSESFVVFKTAPTATLDASAEDGVIHADYTVTDDEKIAENINLVLRDANGETLGSVPCQELSGSHDFTVENAGAYTVELTADYNAVDGLEHKNEVLSTKSVSFAIRVRSVKGEIENKYAEKNESIDVFYTVEDNTYEDVSAFTIGGSEYKADKQSDGRYKISYKLGKTAGEEKLELTSVIYSGSKVNAKCSNSIEVLKDAPTVTDFDYDGSGEKAVVSFELNDPDSAFISGTITVADTNGVEKTISVDKSKKSYDLGLTKNGVYTVSVKILYDRDSNRDDGENQTERELYSGAIQVFVDYEFTYKNPVLKSIDNKTRTVTLGFESTNASIYNIVKATINGKDYNVERTGSVYTVKVVLDKAEKTVLNITEVELEDHKRFKAEGSFTVFKNKPSAKLSTSRNGSTVSVDYTITDADETLTSANVVLKDANGALIGSEQYSALSGKAEFKVENAGSYTAQIVASYDAADGLAHTEETLAESGITFDIEIKGVTSVVNNKYVNKNENAEIIYTVDDNTYEEVSAFVINKDEYKAEKQDNGTYKVAYPAGSEAGVRKLILTAVKYSGGEIKADNTAEIEVLKDAPTVTDFDYDGSAEPLISFKLNDPDEAFISGKITVKSADGETAASIDVVKGKESYALGVDKNGLYEISVNVSYDLDGNPSDNVNRYEKELANQSVQVFVNYDFNFSTPVLRSFDGSTNTATIAFDSTNASMYKVLKVTINDREFEATKLGGNTYTVDIPLSGKNRAVLLFTQAELEDHKKFSINESVTIFKDEPSAKLTAQSGENEITADYEITDTDGTISSKNITLKDGEGRVISSEPCGGNTGSVSFEANTSGAYTVELTADYDLCDGAGSLNRALASQEVTVDVRAYVTSSRVESEFVNKGGETAIFYTITDNTDESVTSLTINGADRPVLIQDDGSYRVSYVAGSVAGEEQITLSEIKYPSATAAVRRLDKVEVLKDKPTAEIVFDNSGDQPKLTVNITDDDEAVTTATASVLLDGSVVKKETVKAGSNEIDISSLDNNEAYAVNVVVDYDLDGKDNGKNNDKFTQSAQLVIIKDYNFALSGLAIDSIDLDDKEINLSFESSNISKAHFVNSVVINGETYTATRLSQVSETDLGTVYKYTVTVPYDEEKRQQLNLTQATLDNMKSFNVSSQSVVVFKQAPTAENLKLELSEQEIFSLSFDINDADSTLKALYATLTDYKGDAVETVKAEPNGDSSRSIAFKQFDVHAGVYKVELTADYELADGAGEYKSQSLGSDTHEVMIQIDSVTGVVKDDYADKGEQVEITYTITDNAPYYVRNFEIESTYGGKTSSDLYDVTRVSDEGDISVYTVKATMPDKAGAVRYELKKINYIDDDESVDAEYTAAVTGCTTSVEVLKSEPQNTSYELDEQSKTITFDVFDDDGAVTGVSAKATDKATDKVTELTAKKSDGSNYTLSLSALGEAEYSIEISINYDRDTNANNGKNNGTLTLNKEIDFSVDYSATISGTKPVKIDLSAKLITLAFNAEITANGKPTSAVDVQTVKVKGHEQTYAATKGADGEYTVEIPYDGDKKQTFTLESVTLTNGLTFECSADNSVTIFKTAPKANDLSVTEKSGAITAQFGIEDKANTLSGFKAVLKDGTGAVLETKEFKEIPNGGKVSVKFSHDASAAGKYTVSVLATYNRLDGVTHSDEELISGGVTVDIKPTVTKHTGVSKYTEKGADITVTYTVNDNTDESVTAFIIDGESYNASAAGADGQYTVTLKAPDAAGEKTFKTESAVYGEKEIKLTAPYSVSTEVLKTAPQITDYTLDPDNLKASFNVVDDDGALVSGKAVITGGEKERTVCEFKEKGSQSFDIPDDLDSDTQYRVVIKVTYDLDSEMRADSENYTPDKTLISEQLELNVTYDVKIGNVDVIGLDKDEKTVDITFTADGDERRSIERIFVDEQEQEYYTEYDKSTGVYTVKDIPYFGKDGERQELRITKFFIETGIEFNPGDQGEAFVIFKNKPTVNDLEVVVDNADVYTQFKVVDEDNTISNLAASLTKSTFNEVYGNTTIDTIDSTDVELIEDGKAYSVRLKLQDVDNSYNFNFNVLADYDPRDGEEHIDEQIGTKVATVKIKSKILSDSLSSEVDLGGDDIGDTIEKNQKIRLAFEISDNTEWDATRMVINGHAYNVSKDRPTDNGNIYFADVITPEEAGTTTFNVSSIYYGENESDVEYKTRGVTILKAKPGVENYVNGGTAEKPYLSFTFADPDNALTSSAKLTIRKETTKEEVYTKTLQAGEKFNLDMSDENKYPEGIYEVIIKASYNMYDDKAKEVKDASLLADNVLGMERRIQVKKGYNFSAYLTPVELFQDGYPFMFYVNMNSIKEGAKISGIKLAKLEEQPDGTYTKHEYEDSLLEYSYEGHTDYCGWIDGWTYEKGLTNVYYESVTLEDGQELILDWFSDYTIVGKYPEATKVTLKEDVIKDCVNASATISDPDKTINRLRFRLKAANNRVLDEKFLNKSQVQDVTEVVFDKKMPMTSQYKLEVIAEFDPEGRGNYYTNTLGTAAVSSAERVVIRDHLIADPYPNKGDDVVIGYQMAHNLAAGIEIIGMKINGEQVDLSSQDGDWYRFVMPAPTNSGVYEYTATDIILSSKTYNLAKKEPDENGEGGYNLQPTDKVDVLKDKPYVTGIKLEDDPNGNTAKFTFNVEDPDGALNESSAGVATVNNTSYTINQGGNTISFTNIPKDQELSFDVVGNYDLDTNELENEAAEKNRHEESILDGGKALPFMVLDDYGLNITDLKALNSNGEEESYFEKGASIDVSFSGSNNSPSDIDKIEVNGGTYEVTKNEDGSYNARVNGYTDAGKKDLRIDKVILENGKELDASSVGEPAKLEILKDRVSVEKFGYTSDDSSMTLSVKVKDTDDSLLGNTLDVTITDSETSKPVKTVQIEPDKTSEITFNTTGSRKYDVSVKADYTRDIENTDTVNDEEIYQKVVSMDSRAIEMKEILDITLFKVENGNNRQIDVVELDDIQKNLKDYVVRIDMENLPSFYSSIESTELRNGSLVLKIYYEGAVDYSDSKSNSEYIEVEYQYISDNKYAYEGSFEALMRKLRATPGGTFKLDKNYDASTYSTDASTYFGDTKFTGTLDGNGYTISNLTKPLFNTVENASISNLYLTNITLTSLQGARAPLANAVSKTNITGVHISNIKTTSYGNTTSGYGSMSGMVGDATNGSNIRESSVTNLTLGHIYLTHLAGGMVRELKSSTISNCYVEGIATTGWWGNGGIVGSADQNSTIESCISNMSLAMYIDNVNAGIAGSSGGATLKNNIAIATKNNGNTSKLFGNSISASSENNYQLSDVPGKNNGGDAVKTIESSHLSEDFYKNELKLDTTKWDITGASPTKVPTLKNDRTHAPYVPSQERIKNEQGYDESKETAYNNLYKLMPFYDSSYIIEDAAKNIKPGDDLNTKRINGVIPYDSDGKIVYVLDKKNYNKLSKITIVFDDLSTKTYDVNFDIYFGDIVCYDIPDLNLKYTYNHYVIDSTSPVIDELVDELMAAGDYSKALDPITPNRDPETYKYYYDEELKNKDNIRDFVVKVLANGNYSVTSGNSVINTAIRSELTNNNKLREMLYAYNYIMRWYSFDIEQFSIADMLMFKGDIFNGDLNLDALTSALLSNPGSTMRPNGTHDFYNGYISSYTGIKTLPEFLDYFIVSSDKYTSETVNDWFTNNFNGVLREVKMDKIEDVKIDYDKIKYRAWEHLSARPQNMLPLLNLPKNSTYVLSYPTSLAIGSLRNYIRDPEDPEQMASFNNSIDNQARLMKTYYNMFLGVLSKTDVVTLFNSKDDYVYDSTRVYETADAKDRVFADKTTNEPHMKWFAVPLGVNYYHNANYAVAGGRDIWYAQGNYFGNMLLYSHEAAHNQDGPLYFKGNGRKAGTGAEDYTTGFFTQTFSDGSPQLNGLYYYDENSTYNGNLSPERINSYTKINDFYKKMFQTTYFLDYLMGEAFLELTPDQQAAVATTIKGSGGSQSVSTVSKADIESMKLEDVEDLTRNKLILASGISQSIYDVRWYDVHSTNSGIASNAAFHYLAYAMLGYAGYDDGFIQYCGHIYDGDLTSLIAISKTVGDDYTSFEQFKTGEYKKLMDHRDEISFIDPDAVVEEFKQALIRDSQDMSKARLVRNALEAKKKYYLLLKRNTDDFRGDIFQSKTPVDVHVSSAKQFVDEITKNKNANIIIDQDLDFSEYTSGTSVVGVTFLGTVDGQNKKLSNLSRPLFRNLGTGVKIENLTIDSADITLGYEGAGTLARTVDNVTVSNVKLNQVKVDSGNKNNAGGLFGSAANSTFSDISANNVTVTGGKNVGGVAGLLTNCTVTNGSIDTVNVTGTSDCVGGYVGEIVETTVKGTRASNVTATGKNSVGGLLGSAVDSKISEAAAENVTIEGARNNIGGLVGNLTSAGATDESGARTNHSELADSYAREVKISAVTKLGGAVGNADKNSVIKTSSSATVEISGTADSVGGFIGELYDTEISDCYSANATVYGKNYIGGFAGYTSNPKIINCYSHGSVTSVQANRGGFIGTAKVSAELKNNIAFAIVPEDSYKFDPSTNWDIIKNGYSGNYEVEEYPGRAATARSNVTTDYIAPIKIENVNDGFFTTTLKWNTATWDLSKVQSRGLPRLNGKGNALKESDTFTFNQPSVERVILAGGVQINATDAALPTESTAFNAATAAATEMATELFTEAMTEAQTDVLLTEESSEAEADTQAAILPEATGITEPIVMMNKAIYDVVNIQSN